MDANVTRIILDIKRMTIANRDKLDNVNRKLNILMRYVTKGVMDDRAEVDITDNEYQSDSAGL